MKISPTIKFSKSSLRLKSKEQFLISALSLVFIVFGLLKILDISPVRGIVEESFVLFEQDWAFFLLGLGELLLGIGLLLPRFRQLASALIVLHLLGTIITAVLNPDLTFDEDTVLTVYGEFVLKNLVLMAVACFIYLHEKEKEEHKFSIKSALAKIKSFRNRIKITV